MKFSALLAAFVRLAITPIKPGPAAISDPVAGIYGQQGAMPNQGNMGVVLSALSNNGSPAFGNWSQTLIAANLTAATYSGPQMVGGIIRRFGNAAGTTTDSTDTGTNIVNAIPGATPLQTFLMFLANMGSGALAMVAGSGVSLAGTNLVGGFSARLFLGQVTASNAVTMTGLFSFGLSSGL